jgi:hypothetical protein
LADEYVEATIQVKPPDKNRLLAHPVEIALISTLADVDGLMQEVERLGSQVWREHHGEGVGS